jgi:hypothetical protein
MDLYISNEMNGLTILGLEGSGFVVHDLIAFLPSTDGIAIFEGYANVTTDLPTKVDAYLRYPGTEAHTRFQLLIRSVNRKGLTSSSHAIDIGIRDGIETSIIQPNYLVILQFYVIDKETNSYNLPWNICIDNRFESKEAMLQAYLELVEVSSESIEPCTEDSPFYMDYYAMKKRCLDVYRSDYDAVRAAELENVKQGRDTDVAHLSQAPQAPAFLRTHHSMETFLAEWREKRDEIRYKKKGARGVIQTPLKEYVHAALAFLDFLEESIPFLQRWCGDYLCEMTLEDKLRGWLTYGVQCQPHPPPDFETHWRLFFRRVGEVPDIAVLDGKEFDISYRRYLYLLKKMYAKRDFSKCADAKILDLHRGIDCDPGLKCLLCEEQRVMWSSSVFRTYRNVNNIFINRTCGMEFIEKWLASVVKMTKEEKATIHYIWPPVKRYYIHPFAFSKEDRTKPCPLEEYLSSIGNCSLAVYDPYEFRPKTNDYFMMEITVLLERYYSPPTVDVTCDTNANRWNEAFLYLSHFITYAPYSISIHRKRFQTLLHDTGNV